MPELDDDLDDDNFDDADLDEGIFEEPHDIFSSKGNKAELDDHRNPVITREEEQRQMYQVTRDVDDNAPVVTTPSVQERPFPAPTSKGKPPVSTQLAARRVQAQATANRAGKPLGAVDRHQLVAVFDDKGRPLVAKWVNGKQKERFRPPTKQEALAFNNGGRWVKGGPLGDAAVVADPSAPAAPATTGTTVLGYPLKTVVMWGGGLALLGFGAWWVYKRNKADADTKVRHVEG